MRKLSALRTYYLIQAVYGLLFSSMVIVSAIYRVQVVGLNPLQLVLVGTVLEAAYFLAEIPTGVVADAYSRKLSLIIGFMLIGVGFVVEGLFPFFGAVLLAQVIWGVGATFLSGAESAWIAGEIGEHRLTHVMIRGGQIGRAASIAGVLLGMAIGSLSLGLTFVIAGLGIALLGLALIFIMPETNFQATGAAERDTWGKLADTFRGGAGFVRASSLLQIIFAIELSFGLASEGLDRLSVPHLLEDFVWPTFIDLQPVVWLGVIQIINSLLGIFTAEWLRRKVPEDDAFKTVRVIQLLSTLSILAILAFAFASSFTLGIITYVALMQFRHGGDALYEPWVTKQIEPQVRATVLSMWGQMNAIGQMIGGPLIGAIATLTTLSIGYASTALLLLPVSILFAVILRRLQAQSASTRQVL